MALSEDFLFENKNISRIKDTNGNVFYYKNVSTGVYLISVGKDEKINTPDDIYYKIDIEEWKHRNKHK